MDKETFFLKVNSLRKTNRNHWSYIVEIVEGKQVSIKFFDCYIQRYFVDGVNYARGMDESVSYFNETLKIPFAS